MKWTNDFLNEKRKHGDPLADKAAAALFELINSQTGDNQKKKVARFISEFVSHDFTHEWDHSKHELKIPKELFDYFEDMTPFNFTHEESKVLERGSQFFTNHGPKIILILYARSLIKQYAHTKAIQVLRMTTLLEEHVHRRIIETMQFVADVMNPIWHHHHDDKDRSKFNTNHVGKQSIQKLRLVHAMVRYKIKNNLNPKKEGTWDYDWGFPINQEDMIFATHTFSIEVIKGLQQIGTELKDEEINDYYQTWSLIGRALGVDMDLIPDSYEEGVKLQDKIYERHFTLPNDDGPVLAKALIQWVVEFFPGFSEQTALTLIKEINGPENEKLIETHLKLNLNKAHNDLAEHVNELDIPGIEGADSESKKMSETDRIAIFFIQNLLTIERGGKNSHFRIGDGFLTDWNINQDREKPMPKKELIIDSIILAIRTFFLKIFGYFNKEHDGHEKHKH
ncbi:DUF2236 domain-containing protein [Lutimonas saemankumensis]|uniref:oxygenase MpaB family protein n=1 Tax=Lutimonas saemankumensis TaxID=483016 RepID=UPI001CD64E32|nr:oxygenase MpaB family protein [Lutimonas saemankumensis]MCA0933902.1 DUF2236 domain-containing protein [Lutimonas saemankumensis]